MNTTRHPVDLRYTLPQLLELFTVAHREDVDKGGRYDARSGAINVWSHPWTTAATWRDSEILGTFYVHRGKENRIWCIETDEGFGLDDLLAELATLEQKACGQVIHGIVRG
jgi:hypothetical protein